MAEKESRRERKKLQKNEQPENKNGLGKIYYWIIGILFLILVLLVFYIFAKSGDKVDLGDGSETNSTAQEEVADVEEDSAENQSTSDVEEVVEEEAEGEEPEETVEEEGLVNEDAPLDTSHTVDYSNGSADRIAIKNKVMQVTGLENDLIEQWVGNDGPGRVSAVVYSPDKSEIYRVYLQYGDGEWHATNYESLSSIPSN